MIPTLVLFYTLAGGLTALKSIPSIMSDDEKAVGWEGVGAVIGCVVLLLAAGAIWPIVTLIYYVRHVDD